VKSALYEGRVRHRRFSPVEHSFEYRIFYAYLDLDELPDVLDPLPGWSARGPAFARFHPADHLGGGPASLRESVCDVVESQCRSRPDGAIRLLTLPRTLGVAFNPVSFFYCFRRDGSLGHILAEVDNTPWGERHCYAVDVRRDELDGGRSLRFRVPKSFHVSPFHPMDQEYEWRFTLPGRSLVVHMENRENGHVLGDATLNLRRKPLTQRNAAFALVRHPAMAVTVLGGIYSQAARLWWKGAPYHPHPNRLASKTGT